MRYIISFTIALSLLTSHGFAQLSAGASEMTGPLKFEVIHQVNTTAVKNQGRTGTCWSFSCSSFLESELIRMGKKGIDLSEMYSVRKTYSDKAENHIRYNGKSNFSQGSLGHDVLKVYEKHGIVPESAYTGVLNSSEGHNHNKMESKLVKLIKKIAKVSTLSTELLQGLEAVMDTYMGEVPETFEFEGKTYTPRTFADEVVGIHPNDYISFTSFTHHPFYRSFVLEVPDNYSNGLFYNLPVNELEEVTDYALKNGFSLTWDGDVSNKGFDPKKGVALQNNPVTQKQRQLGFDSQVITDDHLMHLTGIAKDSLGNEYYITKNSWGQVGPFKGYLYTSKSYFRLNTISILVHRDAVPPAILAKLKMR
ncbi:C1 family peptidase [bacterium]|nr:C1 family peptidase [bacterium]